MRQKLFALLVIMVYLPVLGQTIDIGAGYGNTYFTAPDKYINSVSNLGYGFIESHPISATIMVSIPNKPVSLFLSTVYQKLSGRGFLPIAFLDNSNLLPGEVENKSSLWSFSFGAEWASIKSSSYPFLTAEFLLSGMNEISITQGTPSGNIYKQTTEGVRFGLALGGGITLPIIKGTTIRLGGKYNFYGLFARPTDERSINSLQLIGMFTFPIYSFASDL